MDTEFSIVRNQICDLYAIQERIPIINDVRVFKVNESAIGEKTNKFTHLTYSQVYKEILFDKKYNILLNDESIISMYYQFDVEMNIMKHSLSFIPSLDMDIVLAEETILDHQVQISQTTNNYIRIDFDSNGKKDIVHTDVHMHYGIFYSEREQQFSEIRIPIEGIIYPNEFIYIILKYVYELEDSLIDFLILQKYSKKQRLEECELDKLVLTFNRNSFLS